jgi:MFS family permease
MLKNRLHSEPSRVQELSSTILGIYGALGAVAGPIIGHFADKSPDRKMPLLISLSLCILGTFLVAGAESLIMLFLGRMMQGIAGSAVWIVGFATIADTMTPDRVGFGMSFMLSFANSGTIGGPMISGLLLETTGYWATWSVPLLVLTIDLIARVVMIQTPAEASASPGIDSTRVAPLDAGYEEQDTLSKKESFWRIILLDGRVITCLLTTILSMSVTGSFEATIPLYVLESFGWGPSTVGILFSGLVIPGIMVGPIAGWVHDRIGARLPALICSVLQAAILVALGGTKNKPIFIACIIAIGTLRPFVSGIAPAELTGMLSQLLEPCHEK